MSLRRRRKTLQPRATPWENGPIHCSQRSNGPSPVNAFVVPVLGHGPLGLLCCRRGSVPRALPWAVGSGPFRAAPFPSTYPTGEECLYAEGVKLYSPGQRPSGQAGLECLYAEGVKLYSPGQRPGKTDQSNVPKGPTDRHPLMCLLFPSLVTARWAFRAAYAAPYPGRCPGLSGLAPSGQAAFPLDPRGFIPMALTLLRNYLPSNDLRQRT